MDKKNLLFFTLLITIFLSTSSFALVDYSEESSPVGQSRSKKKTRRAPVIRKKSPRSTGGASVSTGMFNVGLNYESISLDVKSKQNEAGEPQSHGEGKVQMMSVSGHFETSYDLYLDFSYWRGSTSSKILSENDSSQGGNPKLILGFNWLKFGQGQDSAAIDLYAGGSFSSSSALASSRTDKIFGIETSKRFYVFALSFGYEYQLTGTPDNSDELGIGNLQKIKATAGWMVSGDIQIGIEGGTVRIGNSNESDRERKLMEKLSYGYVRPSLFLGLMPSVTMELGATFRTDKLRTSEIATDARLWNQPGIYGNSLFSNLYISI